MKKVILTLFALTVSFAAWFFFAKSYIYIPNAKGEQLVQLQRDSAFVDGDIIFQESQSAQCEAIKEATKSKYSHCGIIFKKDNKYFVYEAIEPVTITQLNHWIAHGKDNHFVVKRLKNAEAILTVPVRQKMLDEARKHQRKHYDLAFSWTDDKMYCSELIWKIYKRGANIEIGKLQKLSDFDLTHPLVEQKVKERYGNNIPFNEIVISPISIFNSENLYTVVEN